VAAGGGGFFDLTASDLRPATASVVLLDSSIEKKKEKVMRIHRNKIEVTNSLKFRQKKIIEGISKKEKEAKEDEKTQKEVHDYKAQLREKRMQETQQRKKMLEMEDQSKKERKWEEYEERAMKAKLTPKRHAFVSHTMRPSEGGEGGGENAVGKKLE